MAEEKRPYIRGMQSSVADRTLASTVPGPRLAPKKNPITSFYTTDDQGASRSLQANKLTQLGPEPGLPQVNRGVNLRAPGMAKLTWLRLRST